MILRDSTLTHLKYSCTPSSWWSCGEAGSLAWARAMWSARAARLLNCLLHPHMILPAQKRTIQSWPRSRDSRPSTESVPILATVCPAPDDPENGCPVNARAWLLTVANTLQLQITLNNAQKFIYEVSAPRRLSSLVCPVQINNGNLLDNQYY